MPLVRSFYEVEKKALQELLPLPHGFWQDESFCLKTQLWEGLKWVEEGGGEEDEEASLKKILLQVQKCKDPDHCSWYAVPVTHPSENSDLQWEVLSPIPGLELCDKQRSVAFPGNRIFSFGGSYRRLDSRGRGPRDDDSGIGAKFFDLENPATGWQKLPDMVAARDYPSAVVSDGKIFVVGGMRYFSGNPFVEVYDHNCGSWEQIDYGGRKDIPPLYANIPGGTFTDEETGHKHILFRPDPPASMKTSMYLLNLETYSIDDAETPFPDMYYGAVVAKGILYTYQDRTEDIRAFDLKKKIWISGAVTGLDKIEKEKMLRLVRIGGKLLGVIQRDNVQYREKGDGQFWGRDCCAMRLILTVFRVDGLKAKVLSSKLLIIPDGTFLYDFLII